MSIELKVVSNPAAPVSWNYEEIKNALATRLNMLSNLTYDETQVREAKSDKADLNRLKKALNDERIAQEKAFMGPFQEFKGQVKELCLMIDKTVYGIDSQVSAFEEKRKAEKRKELELVFEMTDRGRANWLTLEQIFDTSWLNASVTLAKAKIAMKEKIERINLDIDMLSQLPDYGSMAVKMYEQHLNAQKAMNDARSAWEIQQRIEELKKAEPEPKPELMPEPMPTFSRPISEPEPEPERIAIRFVAELTRGQAREIDTWFKINHINYRFERA